MLRFLTITQQLAPALGEVSRNFLLVNPEERPVMLRRLAPCA